MIQPSIHTDTAIKNPTPKNAKVGDYFEIPDGYHRKYILEINGDRALLQDAWVKYLKKEHGKSSWNGMPIVSYDTKVIVGWEEPFYHNNVSKLANLRRWGMVGNR